MDKKPNKKFSQTGVFIFIVSYLSLVVIITPIALDLGNGEFHIIGNFFIGGGIVVAILGFLFMDRGRAEGMGMTSSMYENKEIFKRIRKHQKSHDRVLIPIMFSGAALTLTGLLLNSLI